MDIHDMSRRYGIALKKLRAMERDQEITCDPPYPILAPMRHNLARNVALTVEHLAALIERPKPVGKLDRHAYRAREQLGELGNPQPAPADVAVEISAVSN